jgi:molybdenum cofactor cytidylyltransferase
LLVNTIVVHRPEDEAVRSLAREYHAYPVANRNSEGELSDSLRTGIETIANRQAAHDASALLICLGDQPQLRLEVIRVLIESWRAGGLQAVRPAYRDSPGEPGHPLLVDRSLWGYAAEMRGESGLAPVLARRGIGLRTISVGGRNPDVDTLEDLRALQESASGSPG